MRETMRGGEDWRVGRGGSGERGDGLNYVRRVALCYGSRRSRRASVYVPGSLRALRAISVNYSLGVPSTNCCISLSRSYKFNS